jgi:hypothetical protein
MLTTAPRQYSPGCGMPGDRGARLAARRAFVALKLDFMAALADVPGTAWLQTQVRHAAEPVDLWLLRAPVFAALGGADPGYRQRRQQLRRGLDSVFPDLDDASGFVTL